MPSTSIDYSDPYLELGPGATLPPLAVTESGYRGHGVECGRGERQLDRQRGSCQRRHRRI
jgi:hypothetical protein